MKKLAIIIILNLGFAFYASAQDYTTGVGFRGGFFKGLSVKHFIDSDIAIEGLLTSRWEGLGITGLYEIHKPLGNVDHLVWYYGAGAHIGFWSGDKVDWADDNESYTVIGADVILGVEYNFQEIPINISLDWKPAVNIIGHVGLWTDGAAFSIRYIF